MQSRAGCGASAATHLPAAGHGTSAAARLPAAGLPAAHLPAANLPATCLPAASLPAAGRGNHTNRGNKAGSRTRFSVDEMNFLLDNIEEIMPSGPETWELVAEWHSTKYGNREALSLQCKFQELYNKKLPTGDPVCPDYVHHAKRLRDDIELQADMAGMDDMLDLGINHEDGEVASGGGDSMEGSMEAGSQLVVP